MPRYSSANIENVEILKNPVSVEKYPSGIDYSSTYKNLPSDLALSWDNDLVFDSDIADYKISQHLLAYAQRLFLALITQRGSNPESPTFGWDFSYLIDKPVSYVKDLLPSVVNDVKKLLEDDPDTLSVDKVEAAIVRVDKEESFLRISIVVRPKKSSDIISFSLRIE